MHVDIYMCPRLPCLLITPDVSCLSMCLLPLVLTQLLTPPKLALAPRRRFLEPSHLLLQPTR